MLKKWYTMQQLITATDGLDVYTATDLFVKCHLKLHIDITLHL